MIRWIMGILVTILLLITISLGLLLTPTGLKISLKIAETVLPGTLHYKTVSGVLTGPLDATGITYQHNSSSISIGKLHLQWKPSRLFIGKLHIKTLQVDDVSITSPVSKKDEPFELPRLKIPLAIQIDKLQLNRIKMGHITDDYPTEISTILLQGKITSKVVKINLKVRAIKPYEMNATLIANGSPSDYQFTLSAHSDDINWKINGTGGKNRIQMSTHEANTLDGSLNGTAKLQWLPWKWEINLETRHLNAQRLNEFLPRRLNMKLNSQGTWKSKYPVFSINASINAPEAQIQIVGNHHQQWNLNWKVDINRLSSLFGTYSGSLHGAGKVVGPTTTPRISGQLNGRQLALFGNKAASLNTRWNVDLSYNQASQIHFEADKLETPHLQLTKLIVNATGKPHTHQMNTQVAFGNNQIGTTQVDVLMNGAFAKDLWRGQISRFNIQSTKFGQWRLNQAAQLTLSSTEITTTPVCLKSTKGKACFQGNWYADKDWEAKITANGINLTPILALLKSELEIDTPATIDVKASGDGGKIEEAEAVIKLGKGRLNHPTETSTIHTKFNSALLKITLNKQGLNSTAQLQLSQQNNITVTLALPDYLTSENSIALQPIKGNASLNISDLSIISAIAPQLAKPKGKLVGNVTISGTLTKPFLHGQIQLQRGSVEIPQLQLTLNKIAITLDASGHTVHYQLQAYSKDKPIKLSGETELSLSDKPTRITLEGNDILISDTAQYTVYISPKLQIEIKGNQLHFSGSITIPKALLKPIHFKMSNTLPEDVVFVGSDTDKQSRWETYAKVKIIIGDDVKVDARGLTGQLKGEIDVTK